MSNRRIFGLSNSYVNRMIQEEIQRVQNINDAQNENQMLVAKILDQNMPEAEILVQQMPEAEILNQQIPDAYLLDLLFLEVDMRLFQKKTKDAYNWLICV